MKLSAFGEKFSGVARPSGIVELMDDLGQALSENPQMIFMGGGNPAHIPAVEQIFEARLREILASEHERRALLGIYQSPQGDKGFRQEIAAYLRREFGWNLGENNIAVANGSQSAYFVLYNLFAGPVQDGTHQTIHLPLSPEYIGYADAGLSETFFTATRPDIQLLDDQQFKYRVDFSQQALGEHVGAISVSRPTNPTGNVLTDDEVQQLDALARAYDIPLMIDGAYGLPFPSILFAEATPHWNDNVILVLSLSKLGLPGVRTGIVVASEPVIQAYTHASTIISLASGNLGPALVRPLFRDGGMRAITAQHITPFYQQRALQTVAWLQQAMPDIPLRIHAPEGAIFLWLWFEGLPIDSQTLYQRLKAREVLVVPGENFFIGVDSDWQHQRECIRVSYAQDPERVQAGVRIIADEVRRAYAEGS